MREQSVHFYFLASWMPTSGPESWYAPGQDKTCQVCIHLRFAKDWWFPQYRQSLREFSEQIAELARGPEVAYVSGLNRRNQGLEKQKLFNRECIVIAETPPLPSFYPLGSSCLEAFHVFCCITGGKRWRDECCAQLLLPGCRL